MSETSPDKSPLEAFLHQYWKDREAGCVRGVREYLDAFPGADEAVAAEYTLLQSRGVPEPDAADSIGPYQLEEEVGRGGQGTVYRARSDLRRTMLSAKKIGPFWDPTGTAELTRIHDDIRTASDPWMRDAQPGVADRERLVVALSSLDGFLTKALGGRSGPPLAVNLSASFFIE